MTVPTALLLAPLALQAAAMGVDEGVFHRRRGLPRWERIGHPLDTATVLVCFAVAAFAPPTAAAVYVYVALAVFSCLFVTKDERVHAQRCTPGEHWLHAVLFVLHPVTLAAVGLLWMQGLRAVVVAQGMLTLVFGLYQLVFWNLLWRSSWLRQATRAR